MYWSYRGGLIKKRRMLLAIKRETVIKKEDGGEDTTIRKREVIRGLCAALCKAGFWKEAWALGGVCRRGRVEIMVARG